MFSGQLSHVVGSPWRKYQSKRSTEEFAKRLSHPSWSHCDWDSPHKHWRNVWTTRWDCALFVRPFSSVLWRWDTILQSVWSSCCQSGVIAVLVFLQQIVPECSINRFWSCDSPNGLPIGTATVDPIEHVTKMPFELIVVNDTSTAKEEFTLNHWIN